MRRQQAAFDATGATIYAISFETPARVRAYVRYHQLPYPVLADPARRTYADYGMGRGRWWRIYNPHVIWEYVKRLRQGQRVRIRGDTLQRGGDCIVDADGVVRLLHVGTDSFDRATVDEMLARLAAPAPAGGR